jgi:hypothetical protein
VKLNCCRYPVLARKVYGWRSEDRRYNVNCDSRVVKIALHSLKAVPRKLNWVRQMQKLIQRRPPEGGRYKFKNDCNGCGLATRDRRYKFENYVKGWRSEDCRYNVNCKEPARRRRYERQPRTPMLIALWHGRR